MTCDKGCAPDWRVRGKACESSGAAATLSSPAVYSAWHGSPKQKCKENNYYNCLISACLGRFNIWTFLTS